MSYVLGIDLGTSYFKLALIDRAGTLCGLARLPVPKQAACGRCELKVQNFWEVLQAGVEQVCAQAACSTQDIVGISYSSQANSFLLLDEANQPLTPLILWPDLRAAELPEPVERLWRHQDFLSVTGLGLSSGEFMAAKLCWIQAHDPALWASTARVMTISDFLVFGLTGQYAGDEGTASLLGLWDLPRDQWWESALDTIGLRPGQLSAPQAPGSVIGPALGEAARRLGIHPQTPVAAGSLDHHMAALGAGLGTVAEATDSTGTVLALLRNCEEWRPRKGCCMGPGAAGHGYYQLTFSNEGAGALEQYQRVHAPELSITELLELAEEGEDVHGVQVREILERAADTLDHLVGILFQDDPMHRCVATGGGARSNLWLQIKADKTAAEFVVTACSEPACLGAGMFAAVAAGWFPDFAAASASWTAIKKVFQPRRAPEANIGRFVPPLEISVG